MAYKPHTLIQLVNRNVTQISVTVNHHGIMDFQHRPRADVAAAVLESAGLRPIGVCEPLALRVSGAFVALPQALLGARCVVANLLVFCAGLQFFIVRWLSRYSTQRIF